MFYIRYYFAIFLLFFLITCKGSIYEEEFLLVSIPPKSDITMCNHEIYYLLIHASNNTDYLIEQIKNLEKIDFFYYPIDYTRSDVANYILSYRYGSLSRFFPDYNPSVRLQIGNSDEELVTYTNNLYQLWLTANLEGRLEPIVGICDH